MTISIGKPLNILKALLPCPDAPEELKAALAAGCEIGCFWDDAKKCYIVRTVNPIAVHRDADGRVTVYEKKQ